MELRHVILAVQTRTPLVAWWEGLGARLCSVLLGWAMSSLAWDGKDDMFGSSACGIGVKLEYLSMCNSVVDLFWLCVRVCILGLIAMRLSVRKFSLFGKAGGRC
jgi:hypothetical protein